MSDPSFRCRECGKDFSIRREILDRYPGWQPSVCLPCKDRGSKPIAKSASRRGRAKAGRKPARRSASSELNLTLDKVRERFSGGPQDGVFTDGACAGNPGPGGWGVVWVEGGEVVDQRRGHEGQTTNNRMELLALIHAYEMLPADADVTVYSDSRLCVQTINEWAAGWKRRGWKRATGPVKNLDLVERAYELSLRRPRVELRWIKAHDGSLWNEYADSLATSYSREVL